jgi:hypothetical protein
MPLKLLKLANILQILINGHPFFFFRDELLLDMEEYLRDYTKLINYFQKLQNYSPSDYSPSLQQPPHIIDSPASASSLVQTPNVANAPLTLLTSSLSSPLLNPSHLSQSFPSQINHLTVNNSTSSPIRSAGLEQFSLKMAATNLNQSMDSAAATMQTLQMRPSQLDISFNPQILNKPGVLITPLSNSPLMSNEMSPSGGTFIFKKKLDDEVVKSRTGKHNKKHHHVKGGSNGSHHHHHKAPAHSIEIINLLTKLEIPIQMSSQVDECLRELIIRRHNVQTEIGMYQSAKLAAKKCSISSTDTIQFNLTSNVSNTTTDNELANDMADLYIASMEEEEPKHGSISNNQSINQRFTDTQSEISSCLGDSNYESDNNSLHSYHKNHSGVGLDLSRVTTGTETNCAGQFPKGLNAKLTDESDLTLNETRDGKKKSKPGSDSGSNKSDKTVTPSTPKSPPTSLNSLQLMSKLRQASEEQQQQVLESPTASERSLIQQQQQQPLNTSSLDSTPRVNFARQTSDGYASSYTPLSASSVNNEQANVNLFFLKPAASTTTSTTAISNK